MIVCDLCKSEIKEEKNRHTLNDWVQQACNNQFKELCDSCMTGLQNYVSRAMTSQAVAKTRAVRRFARESVHFPEKAKQSLLRKPIIITIFGWRIVLRKRHV